MVVANDLRDLLVLPLTLGEIATEARVAGQTHEDLQRGDAGTGRRR